jgi:hypothetical protein
VIRVPGYRPRAPGSIPGTTRFSEKWWAWNGVHSASWVPWPPLWSSDQGSWLQIQRPGFDSRHYQVSWEVLGLERGPLSLLSTTEELLGRKSSGSGLESREYGRWDPSRLPHGALSTKVGTNFAEKRRSLARSLARSV